MLESCFNISYNIPIISFEKKYIYIYKLEIHIVNNTIHLYLA